MSAAGVRPPATSTTVAVTGTLAGVAALGWVLEEVARPVALGAVGAVLFAASCWLLVRDGALARLLVSALTLPVALGLFGSTAVATLVLASGVFPVPDGALLSVTVLEVTGYAGVVFGSLLAVLGAAVGTRAVVTPAVLRRYTGVVFLTALVPGLYAVAVSVDVVVRRGKGPLADGDVVGLGWAWLTAAEPTGLEIAGFLFVLALAVTGLLGAVVVLPVARLLADPAADARVERIRRGLTGAAAVVIGLQLAALGLELRYAEPARADLLGPALYDRLAAVATARWLRLFLLGVTGVVVAVTALSWVTRRLAGRPARGFAKLGGPLAGGAVVTLVAVVAAEAVYGALVGLVLDSLPSATEARVDEIATEAAVVYGEQLFVAALAFALVAAALCFVLAIRAALSVGSLSGESPGFSLAAAGLFLAVAAAGTVGAPAWLVFGGVLCSLLVYDAGRFGADVGRELRGAGSREVELVHAGATLCVGLAGAGVATLVVSRAERALMTPSPTTSLALVVLSGAVVCFALALR